MAVSKSTFAEARVVRVSGNEGQEIRMSEIIILETFDGQNEVQCSYLRLLNARIVLLLLCHCFGTGMFVSWFAWFAISLSEYWSMISAKDWTMFNLSHRRASCGPRSRSQTLLESTIPRDSGKTSLEHCDSF